MPKVVSITPALPGWYSVYRDEEGDGELPVVLWALVEDDNDPNLRWPTSYSVAPGQPDSLLGTDDEAGNFAGYVYRPA